MKKTGVVGVGDYLTELLEEEGFQVMHHKRRIRCGRPGSCIFQGSPCRFRKIINDNPSIQVVIDLHRTAWGKNTRLVTTQKRKKDGKDHVF